MNGEEDSGNYQYWKGWSDAEIAEKKAEAWEDTTWTTAAPAGWHDEDSSTPANTSWVCGANSSGQSTSSPPTGMTLGGVPSTTPAFMVEGFQTQSSWGDFGNQPSSSSSCMASMDGLGNQPSSSSSSNAAMPPGSEGYTQAWSGAVAQPSSSSSSLTPTSSALQHNPEITAWDENISLAMQEAEVQDFFEGGLAPIPEELPLPFGAQREPRTFSESEAAAAEPWEGESTSLEEDEVIRLDDTFSHGSSGDGNVATQGQGDWWEKILDWRGLRGRPVPPLLPAPGRPPSDLATPKSMPTQSSSSTPSGITQRGTKIRPGIDRWHHLDGSIRNRQRERLAAEAEAAKKDPLRTEANTVEHEENEDTSVDPVSFYGNFPSKQTDNFSTTATEQGGHRAGDTSSDSSTTPPAGVGFWKNGIWHARPRTPAEERAHRGGGGPRRTQRKQERVQSYLAGEWKPAWLANYIAERQSRTGPLLDTEAAVGEKGEVETNVPVTTAQVDPSPPAEPTAYTDPDPWSGQWGDTSSQWWWDAWTSTSSWWDGWTWSTSSTTSPPVNLHELHPPPPLGDAPPNFGLFPEVHSPGHMETMSDSEGDHIWRMQLTNSERALLRGGGVPERAVQRLEDFFQRLEDYDSFELGPESRWALARLARRVDEATEALGFVLEVMLRRLLSLAGCAHSEGRSGSAQDVQLGAQFL